MLVAFLVVAVPFLVYIEGFRYVGSGDTQPAELLPVALLDDGNLDFREFVRSSEPLPYWFQKRQGRVVSTYPILPGLMNVPVFAAAEVFKVDIYSERLRLSMISASLISAFSVLFLFLALERLVTRRSTAVLMAMGYAFGTCVWSVTSRGMFQHGPSLLLLTIALFLLSRRDRTSVAWSGLFLGLAVVNRPTNVLLAGSLALVVWSRHRDSVLAFCLLAAMPLALRAVYAWTYWGSPFSLAQVDPVPQVANFGGNPLMGLAGLLVSPSRGLFVFSPILLFAGLAVGPVLRTRHDDPLPLALLLGALAILLVTSKWTIWWGGHSFGYRLLIEMLPALMVLLAIAWERRIRERPAARAAFLACLAWSVFVQGLGARFQPTGFNQKMDENPRVLWSLHDSDIALATRKALAQLGVGRRS